MTSSPSPTNNSELPQDLPRTPSPRPQKRTPAAQPEDHPTPSKTKKARPSVSPAPADQTDDLSWTIVTRRKASKKRKAPTHPPQSAMSDIYVPEDNSKGISGNTATAPSTPVTTKAPQSFASMSSWSSFQMRSVDAIEAQITADRIANSVNASQTTSQQSALGDHNLTPRPNHIPAESPPAIRGRQPRNTAQPPPPAQAQPVLLTPIHLNQEADVLMEPSAHPIAQPSTVKDGQRTFINGLVITETPEQGWPKRYSYNHNLKDMDKPLRDAWTAEPGPTILATAWRAKPAENSTHAAALLAILHRLVNAPNLLVSPSFRSDTPVPSMERYPGPVSLLITGAGDEGTQLLLNLGTIVTEGGVFFLKHFDTANSGHIGTLEGFSVPAGQRGADLIRDALADCLRRANDVLDLIRTNPTDPERDEANIFIRSITVVPLSVKGRHGAPTTVWNAYANPPPLEHHDYLAFLKKLHNLRPADNFYGRGAFKGERQFECVGCRSTDHPSGLCPFPLIKGWLGPAHTMELPEDVSVIAPTQTPANNGPHRHRGRENATGRSNRGGKGKMHRRT